MVGRDDASEAAWTDAHRARTRLGQPERAAGCAFPDDPAPLEFQVSDPDVLRRRLADAGLHEVRVERSAERPAFASGQELRDWCVHGNPIPRMLVADLTEEQRATFREVLDGMVRERADADGRATLTNAVNIGVGTR